MSWSILHAKTIGVRLFGSLFRRLVTLKAGSGVTITETMSDDEATLEIAASGGGVSAHTALTALAWSSSGHTGTASRLAGFDGAGAASHYAIGSDVQAYHATLAAVAAGTYTGAASITTVGTVGTGVWQGTAVAAVYGGTGQTSYTVGDLLYASTTTALSKLAAGTAGYVLTSGGPGVAPSWGPATGSSSAYTIPTTNLLVHLDADQGITIATGVSNWADQSGNGRDAAQATAGYQPTVVDWGYGGHSALRFDGTDDFLQIPYAAALNLSTLTVYFVFRRRPTSALGAPTGEMVIGRSYDTTHTSPYFEWVYYLTGVQAAAVRFDGTDTGSTSVKSEFAYGSIVTYTVGASGSSCHQDGYQTHVHGTTSITYTNNIGIGIGGRTTTTGGENFRGDIACILIYSVQHTPTQRDAVLAALRELYGTDTLSSGDTI